MDLSILEKVNELVEQGRKPEDIKRELQMGGISPEAINEALVETGAQTQQQPTAPATPMAEHHEKVIMPEPGFDPHVK